MDITMYTNKSEAIEDITYSFMSLQHQGIQQQNTTNELCALLAQITTLGAPHVNPTTDQQDPLAMDPRDALTMECFYCGHWMTEEVMALLKRTSKDLNSMVSKFAKQYKVTVSANWFQHQRGDVDGILTRMQELQKVTYVLDKLEPLRETLTSFTMNNVHFHYRGNAYLLIRALKKCNKLQHLDLSHTNIFSISSHQGLDLCHSLLEELETITEGLDSLVYLNLSDTGLLWARSFVENLPRHGPVPDVYHPDKLESTVGRPLSVYINNNGDYDHITHKKSFDRRTAKRLLALEVNGNFNLFFDSRPMHVVKTMSGAVYTLDSSDDEDNGSEYSW